jgi:hypothetical protein
MYSFTMPEIASEDWHRLLTNPSILSFLQGRQAQASKNYVNVYALGGGEVTRETSYFITSDNTYHYLGAGACNDHDIDYVETEEHYTYKNNGSSRTVTTTVGSYTCDGEIIEHTYDSMEACAIQGAYPCSCVLNHNHLQ